jgi:hypothetical protein
LLLYYLWLKIAEYLYLFIWGILIIGFLRGKLLGKLGMVDKSLEIVDILLETVDISKIMVDKSQDTVDIRLRG